MNIISHDSETQAQGQQVITACAFIHHNFEGVEKVFMPKRAKTKRFLPDVFELPGGHIDFGEDIIAGLKREVMEELHMQVRIGDPFFVYTYTNEIKGSHSIEVVYFGEFEDPIERIQIQPEDHSEFKWFTESELNEMQQRGTSDPDLELMACRKGFALLRGEHLSFR